MYYDTLAIDKGIRYRWFDPYYIGPGGRCKTTQFMPIVAAPIDLATEATFGGNGNFNLRTPIWAIGSDLYAVAKHNLLPNDAVGVYKSSDGGNTWNIQDTGNEPPDCSSFATCLDGAVIYVLCSARSDQANVATRLFSFDCATDTWTLIDNAGPLAHFASSLFRLSTGDFVLTYGTSGSNDLWLASLSGAVWTDIQDLTLVSSAAIQSYDVYGCLDQDDNAHVFFHNTIFTEFWHASVDAALALGTVDALPAMGIIGGAVAIDTSIYVSGSIGGALVVVQGTPLAAPVFTASPAIDANNPDATNLVYDPTAGILAAVSLHTVQTTFTLAQTTDFLNLLDWSTSVIYDTASDPTPPDFDPIGIFPAGMWFLAGTIYLASNYQNSALASFVMFYVGSFALMVSPSAPNKRIDANALALMRLPLRRFANSTGAASDCFPMKKGC